MLHEKKSVLNNILNSATLMFGAGGNGRNTLAIFKANKINTSTIVGFCDNDLSKQGQYIDGFKILNLAELEALPRDTNIIISSMYYNKVSKQLKNLGFNHLYWFSLHFLNSHINGELSQSAKTHQKQINALFDVLDDQYSKDTLHALLNYRDTFDINALQGYVCDPKNIYFDIIKFGTNESIVDGGAFDGDTMLQYIKMTKGQFNKIYAFEPDLKNYKQLNNNVPESYKDSVVTVQSGLYSKSGTVYFSNSSGLGAHIQDNEGDSIHVFSIDDYFKDKEVTYIKMDIEGAEIDALEGAVGTIKKQKPKLAICLYHKMNDLWEIPLLIKKINPEYKLFIRHYSSSIYDTVCYAI